LIATLRSSQVSRELMQFNPAQPVPVIT